METVSKADREAARALREVLADVSGFWYHFDDDSALCQALARHRAEAERRVVAEMRRERIAVVPAPETRVAPRAEPVIVPAANSRSAALLRTA